MRPRSVAVVGASPRPESFGFKAVRNLADFGFKGPIYPIHPSADEVLGIRCHKSLAGVPEPVDCAVIALPADKVLAALADCAAAGVRAAVVYASGFAEAGGHDRQLALQKLCEDTGMRVCGPNCIGIVNVRARTGMYAAPLPPTPEGELAIICQSGSVCILLNSVARLRFSYLVSSGNEVSVDIADYLDFFAQDEHTKVIGCYVESIRQPRRFAEAAAAARQAGKQVVVLKVGRSERGRAAVASHTGSLAGSEAVYADFFRRHGVIAVEDVDELIETLVLLTNLTSMPARGRVGFLNVSGGENSLICDVAERFGLALADLDGTTVDRLTARLPAFAAAQNPLDLGSVMFDPQAYRECVEIFGSDPNIGMLAFAHDYPIGLSQGSAAIYRTVADGVASVAPSLGKPVVAFSGASGGIHPGVTAPLEAAGVAVLHGLRPSLAAISRVMDYAAHLRNHSQSDAQPLTGSPDPKWLRRMQSGEPFSERESKQFLASHGVPQTAEVLATTAGEAIAVAEKLGYPVVLKIESPDVPHKSDVGGVKLDVGTAAAVASGFDEILSNVGRHVPDARINGILVEKMVVGGIEVIAGLSRQAPLGTAVLVGSGGVLTELIRDSALALAPFDRERAAALVGQTRLPARLRGYRGAPAADADALLDLLVLLSHIGSLYGDHIESLDLNPIAVLERGQGIQVLDALLIPVVTSKPDSGHYS
ncbi:MAG TPA: acetate--CoA ligase family protein [Candidatus Dormibacteraeota bacterium]